MSYIDDIAKLSVMRDDLTAKDAATQRLLGIVVSYGGDQTLAQSIIDADVAIQNLVLAVIASTAAGMTTQAAAIPQLTNTIVDSAPLKEVIAPVQTDPIQQQQILP